MNFRLARDQVVLLESAANLWANRRKANDFFAVFFLVLSWELQYNKAPNDWPQGKQWFCFPSASMFPSASPWETLRVSGKQNSLFHLRPVIECFMSLVWTMPERCRLAKNLTHWLYDWFYYLSSIATRLQGVASWRQANKVDRKEKTTNKEIIFVFQRHQVLFASTVGDKSS